MVDDSENAPAASPTSSPELSELRAAIDELDDTLVSLLDQRADLARQVALAKRARSLALHDPERERQVIERLAALPPATAGGGFPREALPAVYREVMSACLSVEQRLKVAYLGPAGTFSHMAARKAFGLAVDYVEVSTIPAVFDAVERGHATYGVVPIENSSEGGVTFTLDSLLTHELLIRSELVLDVTQCLVGISEDLSLIERVYSHPQALAQCRGWLARNLPKAQLVVATSTSMAAREASSDPTSAAIASSLAAELNGLKVLREGIQDEAINATRFVVVGTTDAPPTGHDKTTLAFSTPDERGALLKVLSIFHDEGINLSRIESRPSRSVLWEYVFFADLAGHCGDPSVARAIARLRESCNMTKVLGSYPRSDGRT